MDFQELGLVAFRALLVYLIILFIVRVLGKREVGSFGAFDFIVALILGEAVDEAIYGDVSMVKFLVLVGTIAILHYANSWASYRSRTIEKLTEAEPTVLVEDGQMQRENMAKERISEGALWSMLREQSVDKLEEVKTATLEPNGTLSVLQQEWARPVQKSDLPGGKEKQ